MEGKALICADCAITKGNAEPVLARMYLTLPVFPNRFLKSIHGTNGGLTSLTLWNLQIINAVGIGFIVNPVENTVLCELVTGRPC